MPLFFLFIFQIAFASDYTELQVVAISNNQSEVGIYDPETILVRTEIKHRYLCRKSTGRKLFKKSNIGLPVGFVVTVGAGLFSLADLVGGSGNNLPSALVATAGGASVLIFSTVALPASTKHFYEESKKVGLKTSLTRGKIILANIAIVSGVFLITTPLGPFLILAGYGFHEFQGLKMLATWNCKKYGL
jgi:hypothetical protein